MTARSKKRFKQRVLPTGPSRECPRGHRTFSNNSHCHVCGAAVGNAFTPRAVLVVLVALLVLGLVAALSHC